MTRLLPGLTLSVVAWALAVLIGYLVARQRTTCCAG